MSTFWLLLRLLFALAAVLGLLWLGAKLLSRTALGVMGNPGAIQVISRAPLTRTASVALVQVGDQAVLLGVTDQQITTLHTAPAPEVIPEIDLAAIEPTAGQWISTTAANTGQRLLEQLRARTERK